MRVPRRRDRDRRVDGAAPAGRRARRGTFTPPLDFGSLLSDEATAICSTTCATSSGSTCSVSRRSRCRTGSRSSRAASARPRYLAATAAARALGPVAIARLGGGSPAPSCAPLAHFRHSFEAVPDTGVRGNLQRAADPTQIWHEVGTVCGVMTPAVRPTVHSGGICVSCARSRSNARRRRGHALSWLIARSQSRYVPSTRSSSPIAFAIRIRSRQLPSR